MLQKILETLNHCKHNKICFLLITNYYDQYNNLQTEHTECGWHWDIFEIDTHNIPTKILIYDKGWDEDVAFHINEIKSCIPLRNDPTPNKFNHKELNILIDDMYSNFCEKWDNYDYKNAELIMRHIHQITKDRSEIINNSNYISPFPLSFPSHYN
jgi:hypothetical protein